MCREYINQEDEGIYDEGESEDEGDLYDDIENSILSGNSDNENLIDEETKTLESDNSEINVFGDTYADDYICISCNEVSSFVRHDEEIKPGMCDTYKLYQDCAYFNEDKPFECSRTCYMKSLV